MIADSTGCSDSSGIVITVNPSYTITDPTVAICTGDSALIYGTYQTTAGTYYDSLTTVAGCDSVHSTALTVNPTYNISDPAVTLCSGDSALIYGMYQTTAGTYYDSLTTVSGCDSIHSTVLEVNPTYTIADPAVAICTGDSVLIYGTYRTTAGMYYDSLTTVSGCDSIHSTALTVNPTYNISDPAVTLCSGDSALIYGMYQTTAGTYYDSLTTVSGCDSIHSTALTVNPTYTIADPAVAICTGDSALIYGTYRTTAGTYYDSLNTVNGCDSIRSTSLTVNLIYNTTATAAICSGDSIFLQGAFQTTAGTYYDSSTTLNGCDSIMATTLIINPLPIVSFSGLDTIYCSTDAGVTLTGIPAGGAFSGTGGLAGNQFFPATGVNTYIVTYSYTDSLGCSNSFSQSVSVVQCTGIPEDDRTPQIKIYPNPNTGEFNIEINITRTENLELKITNTLGQEIFTENLNQFTGNFTKRLDLQKYPAGIYTFQLASDTGVITRQITIE